ncbi:MAG: hypothetical protein IPM21_16375 [Acidobacteria bacterium]|nr:hypothetical protein [Acidobacteriota bacterium]
MRNIFVAGGIAILLVGVAAAQAEWTRLNSGTLAHLRSVYFLDDLNGWAGGTAATLLRTKDGGDSWERVKIGGIETILDIYFANAQTGWLLCEKDIFGPAAETPTVILRTNDGGTTWDTVKIEPGRERFLRFLLDAKGGMPGALGESGTLLMPEPDESGFRRVRLATRAMLTSGLMDADGRSIIVGGLGTVLLSMDRGSSWTAASAPQTGQRLRLNAVARSDDKETLIAVGRNGLILRSKDRGTNWEVVRSPVASDLTDVVFFGNGQATAIGEKGVAIVSEDNGATWSLSATGSKHRLERIHATRKRIYAVGFGGTGLSMMLKVRDQ